MSKYMQSLLKGNETLVNKVKDVEEKLRITNVILADRNREVRELEDKLYEANKKINLLENKKPEMRNTLSLIGELLSYIET